MWAGVLRRGPRRRCRNTPMWWPGRPGVQNVAHLRSHGRGEGGVLGSLRRRTTPYRYIRGTTRAPDPVPGRRCRRSCPAQARHQQQHRSGHNVALAAHGHMRHRPVRVRKPTWNCICWSSPTPGTATRAGAGVHTAKGSVFTTTPVRCVRLVPVSTTKSTMEDAHATRRCRAAAPAGRARETEYADRVSPPR